MKNQLKTFASLSATLMAALVLVGCATNTTTLSISYSSPDSVVFYQCRPVAGLTGVISTDTITLKGDTTLVQHFNHEDATYYTIYTNSNKRANLLLPNDGGNIKIKYDPAAAKYGFVIDQGSTNAQGQQLYDSLFKERNMYGFHRDFSKAPLDTVASVMQSNFRALADEQIAQFEALRAADAISQQMFDQAVLDINYYYAYKIAEAIAQNAQAVSAKRMPQLYEGYADLWKTIYTLYPIDRQAASTTSGWYYMSKNGQYDKMVANPNMERPKMETAAQYLQFTVNCANDALANSEPLVQQALLAQSIYFQGVNNKSQELMLDTLIAEYNTKFTGNEYAPYLQRFVDENRIYHEALARPLSDKVIFIENSESAKSLADIFAQFKGQPIFVDFWFSSCGPCRDEFKYSAKLYEFLIANGIAPLFVSVDQPRNDQEWRNAIKFFNLEGHHIRVASPELSTNIFEVHKIHMYPRYMIVDADGKIVEPNAKAPSEGVKLEEQLKEKLKL